MKNLNNNHINLNNNMDNDNSELNHIENDNYIADNWSGEYFCLYTCNADAKDSDKDSNNNDKVSNNNNNDNNSRWRRRIIWLTVYEPDPNRFRNLQVLFWMVGLLGFVTICVGVYMNAEIIKHSIWRCIVTNRLDGTFTYIAWLHDLVFILVRFVFILPDFAWFWWLKTSGIDIA